jgi:hypothetical protein
MPLVKVILLLKQLSSPSPLERGWGEEKFEVA